MPSLKLLLGEAKFNTNIFRKKGKLLRGKLAPLQLDPDKLELHGHRGSRHGSGASCPKGSFAPLAP